MINAGRGGGRTKGAVGGERAEEQQGDGEGGRGLRGAGQRQVETADRGDPEDRGEQGAGGDQGGERRRGGDRHDSGEPADQRAERGRVRRAADQQQPAGGHPRPGRPRRPGQRRHHRCQDQRPRHRQDTPDPLRQTRHRQAAQGETRGVREERQSRRRGGEPQPVLQAQGEHEEEPGVAAHHHAAGRQPDRHPGPAQHRHVEQRIPAAPGAADLPEDRYRNRLRVGRALDRLEEGVDSLAGLAAELGFADQAHLTRTVRAQLGHTPGQLRRLLG
ncbi:helix-turn-helix domain-containing protein [Micromonospora narathiwatensis]|uniref:helix-turn-helix domain-containing protein n=1 Tax=Micromonospora narathiwatensis TaxID=299146 RepID=UPI000B841C3C